MTENQEKKQAGLFDWLYVFLANRRLIILNTIVVGLIAMGLSFLLPKWYQGEVVVLPPLSEDAGSAGISAFLTGAGFSLGGGEFSLPMMTTPADLWKAMIQSRGVADSIIAAFDLQSRYRKKNMAKTRKSFLKHSELEVTGEGILHIRFEDKNPEIAAQVANAIADRLDRLNRQIKSGSARNTREFIEEQKNKCQETLTRAEEAMKNYQEEYGALVIDEQAKMMVQNAAQLQAELLISEIELGILKKTYLPTHDEVKRVNTKINEIELKLQEMKFGKEGGGQEFDFPLMDIPHLSMEYLRLARNLQIQAILYEFLVQQYEQAKIQEAKDTPVINILARATPPEIKHRPKKSIVTVAAAMAAFILTIILLAFGQLLKKYQYENKDNYDKLKEVFNHSLTDILIWRKRREK
ncbi:hypothetical protein JW877_06755 [bacterium]|nr:hypothetical protein [bacterium]